MPFVKKYKNQYRLKMIFYGTLLFYFFLVIVSALFFWWKPSGTPQKDEAFAFPLKNFSVFGLNKAKISRFVTHYECPECGFRSEEHLRQCPRCKAEGKRVQMEARTFVFQP